MDEIRLLTKDDIEVRVAQTKVYEGTVKVDLLLYKNARVDMKILDELFSPFRWQRTHKVIEGRLYCTVSVLDTETNQWISKEDVGTESNTEPEKGQASDAFKRACVNWGIGRELYTAPKISVALGEREYTRDQQGRIRVWAGFDVADIAYDKKSRSITALTIVDRKGAVRFQMGAKAAEPEAKPEASAAVRARRASRKAAEPTPTPTPAPEPEPAEYTPVSIQDYEKIVKAHVAGRLSKTGASLRDTWIAMTHAGQEQIIEFDLACENYRINGRVF